MLHYELSTQALNGDKFLHFFSPPKANRSYLGINRPHGIAFNHKAV